MSEAFSADERVLLRGEQLPEPESLLGWYPVVARQDGLWWRYFDDKRFSEPFFHDTVAGLAQENRFRTWTSFAALDRFDRVLAPTAFVFHVSRCGSTLLTQLLSSLSSCVVMSEPPIIDSYLRLHTAYGGAETTLRKIVSALGQKRFEQERHLFIKLDSWHIDSLPLLRNAFPATPFIFLYRKPEQVLASHRRHRGRQMVPGLVDPALLTLDSSPDRPGDLDGYCVKVLTHFFATAYRHADELILLNYTQLPQAAWADLPELLSLSAKPAQIKAMQARAKWHSKNAERYTDDPPTTVGAGDELCAALQPHYEMLERKRRSQNHFGG